MVLVKNLAYMRLLVAAAFSTFILNTCGRHMKVRYGVSGDCLGKTGTNFIMFTLNDVTHGDCARRCEEMYQCMVFFHNSSTQSCTFHNRTLTDLEMLPDASTCCFEADDMIESWILEIIKVSSSYPNLPDTQMIGPPDEQLWGQNDPTQEEFLEVQFSSEMYMEQIHIYEMFEYGGLREISLLTPDGTWYPVWSTEELESGGSIENKKFNRIMSKELAMTDFKTASIHIDIQNQTSSSLLYNYHEAIDAIRACGKGRRFSARNYVL